ncbi:hypothetical protein WAX86_18980 [Photobacterium damselae subsp. damselae]|uniref:hypothetical protein n=1 Tax=Photobacterium damselae TaxID=38293 RepID=UPI00311AE7CE
MKYIYIYIFMLLSPCLTFAKIISHTFDVSTFIDTSLFYDEILVITGKDGLLPINSGDLFINEDGTFVSSTLVLEAHKSVDGIMELDKFHGETLWSLLKSETLIDADVKDLDLIVKIDGENLEVGSKYKEIDSSVTLKIENIEKIDDLKVGQTITSILTILLEPSI